MSPPLRPPRKGVSYSEALARTYATAPEEEVIVDTIELIHPSFVDDNGAPVPVRCVSDHEALLATLEDDAPLNAGEEVRFDPVYFKFQRPKESESGALPELQLTVDNVARHVIPLLDKANQTRDRVQLIWRPYLTSDLSGPHISPPLTLTLRTVTATMTGITARAGLTEFTNRRFPASEYTAKKFPSLAAR